MKQTGLSVKPFFSGLRCFQWTQDCHPDSCADSAVTRYPVGNFTHGDVYGAGGLKLRSDWEVTTGTHLP